MFISKAVEESIGDEFYSVYDKPLELARTIQAKQLDNTQVNELLMAVALTGMLSEKQHGVNYLFSRPRGRPPRDLCYQDCIEPLKVIVKDIQKRLKTTKNLQDWIVKWKRLQKVMKSMQRT